MTTIVRRLILIALGVIGGLAVWPVAEEILFLQARFTTWLVFLAALGALVGLLMGGIFGAGEGITSRVRERIPAGMLLGAAIGLPGGAVGFLAGQAALWLIAGMLQSNYVNFQWVVLPVSRAIGWAVLGAFVGAGEGVRALSPKKVLVGALGGLVGGLVGGFVIEYLHLLLPGLAFFRLVGLIVLGVAIAACYGIIERGMSFGVLRILAGDLRGKEYLLNQRRLRIGRARRNEIALGSYDGLADRQAEIVIRHGEPVLVNLEPRYPMLVNEQKTNERVLKFGDVIRIGPVKLYYKYG